MGDPDLIDELQRAYDGDAWHGPSLCAVIDGVEAAEARARPIPGAHTTWELVLHVTAWMREVTRRLHGAPAREPQEGDWPAVPPGDDAWKPTLGALAAAQKELLEAVDALPPGRLHDLVADAREPSLGTGVNYAVMIHGVSQHNAYHAGQIRLLRKMASGR